MNDGELTATEAYRFLLRINAEPNKYTRILDGCLISPLIFSPGLRKWYSTFQAGTDTETRAVLMAWHTLIRELTFRCTSEELSSIDFLISKGIALYAGFGITLTPSATFGWIYISPDIEHVPCQDESVNKQIIMDHIRLAIRNCLTEYCRRVLEPIKYIRGEIE